MSDSTWHLSNQVELIKMGKMLVVALFLLLPDH
jgi:hypothetical protein